jgi:hypothetical protein
MRAIKMAEVAETNGHGNGAQASPAGGTSLSDDWKAWLAENRMLGFDGSTLVDTLMKNGMAQGTAEAAVLELETHPYFQAGDRMAQRLRKLESLLSIYGKLGELAPSARFSTIERRSNVSRQEFLERYYCANRPVILLGLLDRWKARRTWNPEYLQQACGQEVVEIMSGRSHDPRYEVNSGSHKTQILFQDYVEMVTQSGDNNDCYLVANNNFLQRPGVQRLYEDILPFPDIFDPTQREGRVFFWFGPAGTVTPMHHDLMNVCMAQIYGRKRVVLIPSEQTHLVYNHLSVYSEVDAEEPDYDRFPRFREVRPLTCVLQPGEVLFLPVGEWHHVRSLDVSITISFTNFRFPNDFVWEHPEFGT